MSQPATSQPTTTAAAPEAAIRAAVLDRLARIAPEVDLAEIDADAMLQEEADLDSMDFLNLVIGISESLHVEVPEADYPKLATLDGSVAYLAAHGARP